MLNDFYERNKNLIISSLSALKTQKNDLLGETIKIIKIKSAKKLFHEWERQQSISLGENYDSFINSIKNYIGSNPLILKDDLIFDQITSLWLIKNNMDKYFD